MRRIDYIIIHHWGLVSATMQSVRNRHVEELGWEDVGYNFFIGNGNGVPDGEIVKGRPIEKGSCQCRGFNSRSISVCMIGNFDRYYPSKMQWKSLVSLLKKLSAEHSVPADCVIGHREAYKLLGMEPERSCPGWKIDLDRLRKEIYPHGSELFTDGARRRFNIGMTYEGVVVTDVEPVVQSDRVFVDVRDLEKIFDVDVKLHSDMRMVDITDRERS